MALSCMAKVWLAAFLLTVVLSTAAAATTNLPTTEADDEETAAQDDTAQDDAASAQDAPRDDPTADAEESTDAGAEVDEVPTGGSAAEQDDARAEDDAEEAADPTSTEAADAGDDGDEGKAGTGKRSVEDQFKDFRDKTSAWFDKQKKKFKEMYEANKEKIKKAAGSWSKKIKDKFNGLSSSIKSKIFEGDFKGLSEAEINSLNKEQLRLLVPMNRLVGLDEALQQKVFDRFKALNDGNSMRRVLESMVAPNRSTLITRLQEVTTKLGSEEAKERLVRGMADKLGNARTWTAEEVNMMKASGKDILKYIPPTILMSINETAIISKIAIPSQAELDKMKPAMQDAWAAFRVHKKTLTKDLDDWTSSDITTEIKKTLGSIPLEKLKMIQNDTLYNAFATPPPTGMKIEPAQGALLTEKLMSAFKKKINKPSPAQVKSFAAGRLGPSLKKFVQPEDLVMLVDTAQRNKTTEMTDMLRGSFAQTYTTLGKRCDVFKRIQKGSNLATFTTNDIRTLVTDSLIGCVPLKYVSMWIENGRLDPATLTPGSLTAGQMRAVARSASGLSKYQKSGGGLNLASLPAAMMSAAAASDIKDADWNNIKNKINTGAQLDKAQRAMFIYKGNPEQIVNAMLNAHYNELVPVADLKAMTAAKKRMAADQAPADSPLRMLSASDPETALPDTITASNADKLRQSGLPFFNFDDVAKSISTDNIQEVLEKLREEEDSDVTIDGLSGANGMSPKMCKTMLDSLAAATQLLLKDADNATSILGTLTGAELSALPSCVVGRLSSDTVEKKATDEQKTGILSSLSNIKPSQLKMMNKHNCRGLVREGLKATKPSGDLMLEEAAKIGMAASCLDGSDINRLDIQAFESLKMYFQNGCMDKSQADAIVNRLLKFYGEPSEWTNLEPLCNLIPLLDDSQLREIPETRLAAACRPQDQAAALLESYMEGMERFEKTAQMVCKRQMSESEYNHMMERKENAKRRAVSGLMKLQKALMDELDTSEPAEASGGQAAADVTARRRRRRDAEPALTCDLVGEAGQGAEPWSVSQLQGMTKEEVKVCQKALGSKMADKEKLSMIWTKLKEAYSNDASKVQMKDIGAVVAAISTYHIKKLNLSTYDAVSAVGQPVMMSKEQLAELAKRARSEFSGLSGEPSSFVADNLVAAGQLIFGMSADDVDNIPKEQLKPVMKTLGQVQWGDPMTSEKLAAKSLELNGGAPENLEAAEVAEMGALVGGLEAMQLGKIKKEAFAGLTEAGMKSIPSSKIAVLKPGQVSFLSKAAALSVSEDQMDQLPEDSAMALKAVMEDNPEQRGGAQHVTGALLATLLLALAVIRLA